MEPLFFYKNASRKIVPVPNENAQLQARIVLDNLLREHYNAIPSVYRENWENVKLYHPSGKIDLAQGDLGDHGADGGQDRPSRAGFGALGACIWF